MVELPAPAPVTTPSVPTEATLPALLVHVPPATLLLRLVAAPEQMPRVPVIAAGAALTETITDLEQPVDRVYTIVLVPATEPVTTPDVPIATTEPSLLLHVP